MAPTPPRCHEWHPTQTVPSQRIKIGGRPPKGRPPSGKNTVFGWELYAPGIIIRATSFEGLPTPSRKRLSRKAAHRTAPDSPSLPKGLQLIFRTNPVVYLIGNVDGPIEQATCQRPRTFSDPCAKLAPRFDVPRCATPLPLAQACDTLAQAGHNTERRVPG